MASEYIQGVSVPGLQICRRGRVNQITWNHVAMKDQKVFPDTVDGVAQAREL